MNYIILFSIIVIICMIIVLCMPKQVTLRLVGINRYDLETIPKSTLRLVFITASLFFFIALMVLFGELSVVPYDLSLLIELIKGLF